MDVHTPGTRTWTSCRVPSAHVGRHTTMEPTTDDDGEEWQALPADLFCEPPIVPVGVGVFELPLEGKVVRVHPRRDAFERSSESEDGKRGVGADYARVTGALLWDSSVVLSVHLLQRRKEGRLPIGLHCVELGAGLGLVGLSAATLGCRVTLTDREEVLPLLAHGVAMNGLQDHAKVAALEWGGTSLHTTARALGRPFALILAADVVYEAAVTDALVETCIALTAPESEVLIAQDASFGRRAAWDAFERRARQSFSWEQLDTCQHGGLGPTKESVALVCLRRLPT